MVVVLPSLYCVYSAVQQHMTGKFDSLFGIKISNLLWNAVVVHLIAKGTFTFIASEVK